LNFFLKRVVFILCSSSHGSTWCHATMFLIGYLAFLIACFLTFDLIFVLWLSWLLARLVCYFCSCLRGII
jgi:hypothetical protein